MGFSVTGSADPPYIPAQTAYSMLLVVMAFQEDCFGFLNDAVWPSPLLTTTPEKVVVRGRAERKDSGAI